MKSQSKRANEHKQRMCRDFDGLEKLHPQAQIPDGPRCHSRSLIGPYPGALYSDIGVRGPLRALE